MMSYNGFYFRRRGILQHLDRGDISLLDSGIHDFLCLIADWRTGVAWASAEKIRAMCSSDINLKAIQRSLAKMENLTWIKRFREHGRRGNYAIVIGKFFVRDASLRWKAVNLEKTIDWRDIQFDPVTDVSFIGKSSDTEDGTEADTDHGSDASPIQEVRKIPETKIKETHVPTHEGFDPPSRDLKPSFSDSENAKAVFDQANSIFTSAVGKPIGAWEELGPRQGEWAELLRMYGPELVITAVTIWARDESESLKKAGIPIQIFLKFKADFMGSAAYESVRNQLSKMAA